MRVIGSDVNQAFYDASHDIGKGLVTGPTRAIMGVAQVLFNLIALLPSLIASAAGVDKHSWIHIDNIAGDLATGLKHVLRGVLEAIPGTVFAFNNLEVGIGYLGDDDSGQGEYGYKALPLEGDQPFPNLRGG
ncbi:MAG: hypothetical protein H0X51_03520 [Parachlamydiaceae bacterium]|nr:hypothetical protein [Parachlamydiaceae bacterium]